MLGIQQQAHTTEHSASKYMGQIPNQRVMELDTGVSKTCLGQWIKSGNSRVNTLGFGRQPGTPRATNTS